MEVLFHISFVRNIFRLTVRQSFFSVDKILKLGERSCRLKYTGPLLPLRVLSETLRIRQ